MPNDIRYVKATLKDKNAVIKLHALLYANDFKSTEKIAGEVQMAIKNKLLWIAKINNQIVGYILCEFFDEKHQYFPNSIFIDGLFVLNKYRGKGIGKILVEKVLKSKFPKQYNYFSVTHDPTLKNLTDFYQSFGFIKNGVTKAGNVMMTKKR